MSDLALSNGAIYTELQNGILGMQRELAIPVYVWIQTWKLVEGILQYIKLIKYFICKVPLEIYLKAAHILQLQFSYYMTER